MTLDFADSPVHFLSVSSLLLIILLLNTHTDSTGLADVASRRELGPYPSNYPSKESGSIVDDVLQVGRSYDNLEACRMRR